MSAVSSWLLSRTAHMNLLLLHCAMILWVRVFNAGYCLCESRRKVPERPELWLSRCIAFAFSINSIMPNHLLDW